jgi:hypothetical protein
MTEEWIKACGRYCREQITKETRKMLHYYNVFVNVPHAFTRVRVQAENETRAKETALAEVRERTKRYAKAFDRWTNDETGKVEYPKRPFEWTPIVTTKDVLEHSTVEDEDVERVGEEE